MQVEPLLGSMPRDPTLDEPPDGMQCPITHVVMVDPVMADDGHSCEFSEPCSLCANLIYYLGDKACLAHISVPILIQSHECNQMLLPTFT